MPRQLNKGTKRCINVRITTSRSSIIIAGLTIKLDNYISIGVLVLTLNGYFNNLEIFVWFDRTLNPSWAFKVIIYVLACIDAA